MGYLIIGEEREEGIQLFSINQARNQVENLLYLILTFLNFRKCMYIRNVDFKKVFRKDRSRDDLSKRREDSRVCREDVVARGSQVKDDSDQGGEITVESRCLAFPLLLSNYLFFVESIQFLNDPSPMKNKLKLLPRIIILPFSFSRTKNKNSTHNDSF